MDAVCRAHHRAPHGKRGSEAASAPQSLVFVCTCLDFPPAPVCCSSRSVTHTAVQTIHRLTPLQALALEEVEIYKKLADTAEKKALETPTCPRPPPCDCPLSSAMSKTSDSDGSKSDIADSKTRLYQHFRPMLNKKWGGIPFVGNEHPYTVDKASDKYCASCACRHSFCFALD